MPRLARHALLTALVVAAAPFPVSAQPAPRGEEGPASTEGIERLATALRGNESFKVRAMAAVQLARAGDARALGPLAEALRSDEHFAVRAAAAGALGRLAQLESIPALMAALNDSDPFVREQASDALARFHTPAAVLAFRDALSSDDPQWRRAAVRAYGDVLRENQSVAPFVVNALGDDDAEVARAAELAMDGVPHERAVPLLVAALQATSSPVKAAAARQLQKRTDKTAVEPLIDLVSSSEEGEDVRGAARGALRAHAAYLDLPEELRVASDPNLADNPERITSLRVVAAFGDLSAWTAVDRALSDPSPLVRVAGARAAADLGGPRAKKVIETARARETEPRLQRQLELIGKSVR